MRERTHGHIGIDLPVSGDQEARGGARPSRSAAGRAASGPRPVRPQVPQAAPRPDTGLAARRPAADPGGGERCAGVRLAGEVGLAARSVRPGPVPQASAGAGARVLARRPVAPRRGYGLRRLMAALALALAAAGVVVGLGRLADLTAQARSAEAPAVASVAGDGGTAGGGVTVTGPAPGRGVTVTIAAPGTVWDVADGVAPGASGPQRAALVDRIVAANSLTSLRVWPGQVLRVPLEAGR